METGDPWLARLVKEAGYRHSDGPRDAVVSFLTGDDMLRSRLAERARDETCLEWVRAVVGGRQASLPR
ncbi:hypothetical protein [Streptomyces sp. Y7]|uniref:hypothetical protein n=1 Tax=Streptomyces sp. Y7 TaxID=3342392 RepID=UPI00371D91F8